ncbi:hypothetical protein OE749_16870 [Aestuariibacter sp. AA17]|uniref:DUF4142 domain-containing protein n=1 Tax=Fluctibacter corallii TaxID=2984329 RepID=A0ABT3ACM1_9ALTE|nr:hypothetical protein [Aestuariibacter sp. AA17]MCV2886370.1 hypothetical protein [Aestuariibacter sp. AA17]
MKYLFQTVSLFLLLVWVVPVSHAASITPNTWLAIDSQVKQLTVEGMQRRYVLLTDSASMGEQAIDDANTQALISQVYLEHGITAAEHVLYYKKNKLAIEQVLAADDALREARAHTESQFNQLLEQFSHIEATSATGVN